MRGGWGVSCNGPHCFRSGERVHDARGRSGVVVRPAGPERVVVQWADERGLSTEHAAALVRAPRGERLDC